jgi:hypothetical protein
MRASAWKNWAMAKQILTLRPIVCEKDNWWRQVIGPCGRMWTIRVRIGSIGEVDIYECWVNEVLLPVFHRRIPENEPANVEWAFGMGLEYIKGKQPAR